MNEVEVGAILLHYWEDGSRRRHYPNVAVYRVEAKGLTELEYLLEEAVALLEEHGYTVIPPE